MKLRLVYCLALMSAILLTCTDQDKRVNIDNSVKKGTDTITVAFYNVQNLFDLVDDGNEYPEYREGKSNWNRDMMAIKLHNIASVVEGLNASILGLCEIENDNALNELQRVLSYKGIVYKYAVIESNTTRNTCPCLLSKYPVLTKNFIPVKLPDSTFSRSILEADVLIGKDTLKIFVNHWPSKHNPESFRLQAALALSSRLNSLPKGTDYVIIGDLNSDYDESVKFKTAGLDDTGGKTGINDILNTGRIENETITGLVTEPELLNSSDMLHYDLWLELPANLRMSYFFSGNHQTPDHILIPSSLYDSTGISYLDNSFKVFTLDGALLKDGKPFGWRFYWKKKTKLHAGAGYSDHLPVVAKFVNSPFKYDSLAKPVSETVADTGTTFSIKKRSVPFFNSAWMLCNSKAELQTDTVFNNASGCMRMKGPAQPGNGCIARILVEKMKRTNPFIKFSLCGQGKLSIRIRLEKNHGRTLTYPVMHNLRVGGIL